MFPVALDYCGFLILSPSTDIEARGVGGRDVPQCLPAPWRKSPSYPVQLRVFGWFLLRLVGV